MADPTYTFRITFDANGGTGAPSTVQSSLTTPIASPSVSVTIPSTKPTRTGYTFANWWYGGTRYIPNQYVSHTFTKNGNNQTYTLNLKAAWTENASTWGTTPSSVQLDGTTAYTFNVTKASISDHHTLTFTLGSETLTYTNVDTSQSVTFPTSWQAQIPNNTSGTISCALISYNASDEKIGTVTKTITGAVPSSVVPTLSITHTNVNSNATIAAWDVLVRGFSAISFSATASGTNGSTITSISFSGAGVQQTGSGTTATSEVLSVTGSQTWTVIATDSRGRTATQTYTATVYDYSPPSISTETARRCRQNGTIDEAAGTYALFNSDYAYSSINGNNALSLVIDSKLHDGSTWTTLSTSYTSGTNAVVGGSLYTDKTYDIRITITDSLGNSATFSVFLPSVLGFAYGLKNDRARFGGIPTQAGLQIDWTTTFKDDATFESDLILGQRALFKSLWTGSWSTDDISVDGIGNYSLFLVKMDGQGSTILATLNTISGTTYFRGIGGFCASATTETTYYLAATLSGTTLTMVNCHSITQAGTRTARTVTEIIGII